MFFDLEKEILNKIQAFMLLEFQQEVPWIPPNKDKDLS